MTTAPPAPPAPPEAPPAPQPAIDPRLRARRIAVQREDGRRRLRRLVSIAVVAAVLFAGWGVTRSPVLDVDRVRVRGSRHTPAERVVAASGIERGGPMTSVDTAAAEDRLAALPWVAAATVARRWPATVTIVVEERRPLASVPAGEGRWALVDREGRVLAMRSKPAGRRPLLEGLPPPGKPGTSLPPAAGALLEVAALLPPPLTQRVRAVVASAQDVHLRLDGDVVAVLGPARGLGEKLLALATVLEQVDLAGVRAIDVRVPSSPSLTGRG